MSLGVLVGLGGYTFAYAKGYSYLLNDPKTCVNCHVMREQYDAWQSSSHHAVAACNDCHTPHALVPKYWVKATNGMRHSTYFTLGNFHEPIRITEGNRRVAEHNCVRCHEHLVGGIGGHDGSLRCASCHPRVGHQD
jgi:cytochrome c nitrite reductase small subunit